MVHVKVGLAGLQFDNHGHGSVVVNGGSVGEFVDSWFFRGLNLFGLSTKRLTGRHILIILVGLFLFVFLAQRPHETSYVERCRLLLLPSFLFLKVFEPLGTLVTRGCLPPHVVAVGL